MNEAKLTEIKLTIEEIDKLMSLVGRVDFDHAAPIVAFLQDVINKQKKVGDAS